MKRRNKLILEFSEFNANRLNPDSAQMSVQVDNPQLSQNAFDKHQDAIRAGIDRLGNIMTTLSGGSLYRNLKSKLMLDQQQITSLKILRIITKDHVHYDVYISFVVDEEEYFGEIKNILSENPIMNSEIFKDSDLVQAKEWVIKTKGLLVKNIKQWLHPKSDKYRLLNDYVICYSVETGKLAKIEKNTIVEVVRAFDNKIIIRYNNELYTLLNDNFIYFNYWFEKLS
jgi:hypothetical protein